MNKFTICALAAALTVVAFPQLAVGAEMSSTMTVRPVTQLKQLALDDGRHAFIGSDHKLYLVVNGRSVPAPAGHYMLAGGGCVNVGADSAVDPASFQRLTMTSHGSQMTH
jgi:hypothetical protein